ncbi:MAG: hypothetical protein FJ213_10550 [Ignavibacteria bacterium]|nr:hypothetical protein [Ignavibacteria bacterium]
MKNSSLIIIFTILTFISCSKEPPKEFRGFDPEIFVMSLGDLGWEAICKIKVEGFAVNEKDDSYSTDLELTVDLITLQNDTLKSAGVSKFNESSNEEFHSYLNLEASFSIDPENGTGNYEVVYYIKDNLSNKNFSLTKSFEVK